MSPKPGNPLFIGFNQAETEMERDGSNQPGGGGFGALVKGGSVNKKPRPELGL